MANLVYRRQFTVEWGHCDPAGIVFNRRFFEYFDWSAWQLFEAALNVKPNELATAFGIVGIPLVSAKARFHRPAKFNDVADIASEVSEFRRSSFEVTHHISISGALVSTACCTTLASSTRSFRSSIFPRLIRLRSNRSSTRCTI